MIDTFVIPGMGHWQKKHRQGGVRSIWREVRQLCTDRMTILPPQVWNTNWKQLATWIVEEAGDRILLIQPSYSYGAGWGAQQLSREVGRQGNNVGKAVEAWQALADPVGRFGYGPLWPLNALNITRWSGSWRTIRLNPWVTRCWWCDQREKPPYGQPVDSAYRGAVEYGGRFDEPHSAMDELPHFHRQAAAFVKEARDR